MRLCVRVTLDTDYALSLYHSCASVNFRTASESFRRSSRARSRHTPPAPARRALDDPTGVAPPLETRFTVALGAVSMVCGGSAFLREHSSASLHLSPSPSDPGPTTSHAQPKKKAHSHLPRQARNDAVELKLRVLDDKLLRAQISEEDKLKVPPTAFASLRAAAPHHPVCPLCADMASVAPPHRDPPR